MRVCFAVLLVGLNERFPNVGGTDVTLTPRIRRRQLYQAQPNISLSLKTREHSSSPTPCLLPLSAKNSGHTYTCRQHKPLRRLQKVGSGEIVPCAQYRS